ncbi:MAG: Isoprenyl transferase [Planctomycetes bacterium ADurb.Bin126]|nr:MAG: Isoprenyl transferase [Planctomycetes bacterium ADurb.Bin126]HOD81317.1 isoprenyl transferase [Phycisphaerae bacterium]HQL74567.1 isoprenyl transferase [Phycisphaerae bacterium]
MADISPSAVQAARRELGVPDDTIPRSVAIIMDGNGRWARRRNLPRTAGHAAGAEVVRRIVTEAARLGLDALTLYSFSIENWRRPREEVEALMHLYAEYLVRERTTVMDHNIRLRHLGRRAGLPESVLRELDESLRVSASNTGMYLCLALNYGSRVELTDAVRSIVRDVQAGRLSAEQVNEQAISARLDTAGVPDPDLLIRTSGEMRISNYLLWQISYAEFVVTDALWPDFDEIEFRKGLVAYAHRHRRFGGLDDSNT